MSKYVANSINNIYISKGHFNPLAVYYYTSKICNKEEFQRNKKNETISLNSTPNIISKKNILYSSVTFNNTYSNENKKEAKKNTLVSSLSGSGSMSKKILSVSQGYPKLSKSFNKKYKNNKNNESSYINYLKPKDNKYKGIDLNLISNSSHRKNENNIAYFRDKIILKKINNKDKNEEEKNIDLKSNEEKDKKNEDTIEDKNNFDKIDIDKDSDIKNNNRMELNSSITSKQNSKIENISINQSTPVSNFHPYEADSSPTNYIKSYSNMNNLTFLTNNNNKKDNKNEEEEKSSISHIKLNQSEFTYFNYSNKISEKEEEKIIIDKLEKINKNKKEKNNNRKKKGINKENYNKGYNNNNYEYPLSRNKIEEKEEEYINSLNNKLQISKEKENNINEIKDSKDQDSILYNKKTEGNENERNENIEMELSNESIKEKSIKDKSNIKEENIKSLKKEEKEKENELEKKEEKEKIDNLEFKDELFEIKNKNEEIKNGKEKVKNRIKIKDTNFINNVNQIAFNDPKYTINAKLNFNYYSVNNCKEGNNNKTENKEINQINDNNINLANELKEKYSLFYDYGTNTTIHTSFQRKSINNKYKYFNDDLGGLEEKKENYNIKEAKNKIKPEMQFQMKIAKKEEKKENRNTLSSFNFGIIKRANSYCKKKIIRKCLINDINKENTNINTNERINELNPYKNNIINKKDLNEKKLKDSSTQYSKEIFDKNNNSYLPIKDYIKNSEYVNYSKNKLKNEFIKRNILFDFEGFKKNYELINKQTEYFNKEDKKLKNEPITSKIEIKNKKINNFPHHNKKGRNKWTLSNEYSLNNINNNSRTKIGHNQGFFSIDKTNKFNRKLNSSVLPANPFDSINKAREYFFFNN